MNIAHALRLLTVGCLAAFPLVLPIASAMAADQSLKSTESPKTSRIGVIDIAGVAPPSPEIVALPLSRGARLAAIRALEDENLTIGGGAPTYFFRYSAQGRLETFHCPISSVFKFDMFRSSSHEGVIGIGICPKSEWLGEDVAARQKKGFEAALSATGKSIAWFREGFGEAAEKVMMPEIIHDEHATYIHLVQLLIGGVGGAKDTGMGAIRSSLMIPREGTSVVIIQSLPPQSCGGKFPICDDYSGTVQTLARQVLAAQNMPDPPPNFTLKPLRPGQPTVCDGIAHAVATALEQSDLKRIPVTETISYKRHSGQDDIQGSMRKAAVQHAQGDDITTAAMHVGEECFKKWFDGGRK